jgi:hypothetical protein
MKLSDLTDNTSWLIGNVADKLGNSPASKLDIRELVSSSGLSPQQVRAALLLSQGSSVANTARAVRISRPALSTWLHHNERFQELYFRLIEDERDEMRQTVLQVARLAVKALVSILTSPGAHPGATVRAAELILKAAGVINTAEMAETPKTSLVVIKRQSKGLEASEQQQIEEAQSKSR